VIAHEVSVQKSQLKWRDELQLTVLDAPGTGEPMLMLVSAVASMTLISIPIIISVTLADSPRAVLQRLALVAAGPAVEAVKK
jgi:hypothetical protein